MNNSDHASRIRDLILDGRELQKAGQRAIRAALRQHKALGQSVVVWRDGQSVWLRPEEIPTDDAGPDQPDLRQSKVDGR